MSTDRSNPHVSRRTALAGLGASAAVVTTTRYASAQDTTTDAAHPIVGLWMAVPTAGGPPGLRGYLAIHVGGTLSSVHSFAGAGIGAWQATGERTADWIIKALNIADVPGTYVEGTATFGGAATVAEDGNTMTTVDAIELRDADDAIAQAFAGTTTYVRVPVEPSSPSGTPEA